MKRKRSRSAPLTCAQCRRAASSSVSVPTILAAIAAIDAMKIDIEGAEDLALAPFLEAAPQALLPRLLLIEVRPADWRVDLSALLRRRGYIIATRSRPNAVWRPAASPAPRPPRRAGGGPPKSAVTTWPRG